MSSMSPLMSAKLEECGYEAMQPKNPHFGRIIISDQGIK